jgi:hypothetical protein
MSERERERENMNIKLPVALDLQTNKLIHISQINKENKSEYKFVCPKCKVELILKMGDIKVHHFAHKNICNCKISSESIIHLMGKEILEENSRIKFSIYNPVTLEWNKFSKKYKILSIEKKWKGSNIIPDVVIEVNGRPIFIELAYTHFIDKDKFDKLQWLGIETWEIDLSDIDIYDYDELKYKILNETLNKKDIILDKSNYKDILNDRCLKFKNKNKLLYNKLLKFYKDNILNKKIKNNLSFDFKYPIITGINYFKLLDIENKKKYIISIDNTQSKYSPKICVCNFYNINKVYLEGTLSLNKKSYTEGYIFYKRPNPELENQREIIDAMFRFLNLKTDINSRDINTNEYLLFSQIEKPNKFI